MVIGLRGSLYYVLFNMEYPCLSLLELRSLLGYPNIANVFTGLALVEDVDEKVLGRAVEISSTLKEAGHVLKVKDICDWEEKFPEFNDCEQIKVTIRRLGGYGKDVSKKTIMKRLKEVYTGKKVIESKKPDVADKKCNLIVILTDGVVVYGTPLRFEGKLGLLSINPHDLPYYSPGALNPWFSRLLSNLAEYVGGTLLDPFCGTASIPIWAVENSFTTMLCGDINPVHCKGGLINYIKVKGFDAKFHVIRWDFNHLPLRPGSVSAIVTDLPYGRSVRSKGSPERELAERFFKTFHEYLRSGGVAVVSISEDLYRIHAISKGMLERRCYMFVHNKLSRVILKFTKRGLARQVDPSSLIRQG